MNIQAPKDTSYAYGQSYQDEQVDKHHNRNDNHWKKRIELLHELVNKWVVPRHTHQRLEDLVVLDVGCSIGTIAIEMALRGFKVYGVDFDQAALDIAQKLAVEEGVNVKFVNSDVAEWSGDDLPSKIDVALCFDIFEHLHDDELGAMLQAIRRKLSRNGSLVFYTFPLEFDYIFYSRKFVCLPLLPFRWLPQKKFNVMVEGYAKLIDIILLIISGKSYSEKIEKISHCNPTSIKRLSNILRRAGYEIQFIESSNIYPFHKKVMKMFSSQYISHRNLYGVALPKKI